MRRLLSAVVAGAALAGAIALAQPPAAAPAPAAEPLNGVAYLAPAWPARAEVPGRPGARGVVRPVEAPRGLTGFQRGTFRAPSAEDSADAAAVGADASVAPAADTPRAEFERSGSFLFAPATPRGDPRPSRRPVATAHFKFVSARPLATRRDGEAAPLRLQRTWFALYEPPDGEPVRGVALVMPGLFNTPEPVIEHLIGHFLKRRWAVLRMMSQPSRFTERRAFAVDPADLAGAAGEMADEMQDRVAECAYAAQGAFAHLAAERPALAGLPRVALGMSGGAMTLPTVVALEPHRYAAAVLIAGGCDYLTIAVESNYRHIVDSIGFEWSAPPTEAQQRQLAALYLERAALDSFHTAGALRGKPVLMIHGTHDGAVPARLGDLLWDRLGRPQRWAETAGHEELFMRLPRKAGDILDWLEQAIAAGPAARPPADASPSPAPR